MELTCQNSVLLPAACVILTEEEMTYVEGGSEYQIGKYVISVNWAGLGVSALQFTKNVCVNFLLLLGQGALNSAYEGLRNGHADGLTIGGTIGHFWRNTSTFGKVSSFVVGGLAGAYVYVWAAYYINTFVSLYQQVVAAYQQAAAQNAASTDATASTTAVLTAA